MIKIIAIAPDDGWAFILEADKIFLLRPPYSYSNLIEVSERVVENAIHIQNFEEYDKEFNNISEIIKFIKDKYVESKKNQGIDIPSSEELRKLLKYASDNVLLNFLNRAKTELIPVGKLYEAESIAFDLIELERVKNCSDMKERVNDLLLLCCQERKRRSDELNFIIKKERTPLISKHFPLAVSVYSIDSINKLQNSISARKQIFSI